MEDYRSKLSQTEDRQLRSSIERVINIFQSNLFQALIGGNQNFIGGHYVSARLIVSLNSFILNLKRVMYLVLCEAFSNLNIQGVVYFDT